MLLYGWLVATKEGELISSFRAVFLPFTWLFMANFTVTTALAQSSPDADVPTPNQGSVSERLQAAYVKTGDISIAYHLARVSYASGDYTAASRWVALMIDAGWKMGLDPAEFSSDAAPHGLKAQISALNAAMVGSRRTSVVVAGIYDTRLVPESIAYDPQNRMLYAGSLARPRLVKKGTDSQSSAAYATDIALPAGVDWGVFYGIKFHAERGELWALNNRRDGDGMLGNLSVLDRAGTLVKSYGFSGEPATELNDLCFAHGYVYATDSTASRVYRGLLSADTLELFYQNSDISFPNGIACNDGSEDIYVSDFRGVSVISADGQVQHQRLKMADGYSLGGIDGMYLWNDHLVGVQNYLGAPKIVMADPQNLQTRDAISTFDVNHPEFRVPTTGFIWGDCLFYIANSSLDALGPDGAITPDGPQPGAAKILALNLREERASCHL